MSPEERKRLIEIIEQLEKLAEGLDDRINAGPIDAQPDLDLCVDYAKLDLAIKTLEAV